MCSPIHCAVSLIINAVPVFYSFCLLETFLLSMGVRARGTLLLASSPWWLGFLVFIQATQVQFLGRELRPLFRTADRCLSEINTFKTAADHPSTRGTLQTRAQLGHSYQLGGQGSRCCLTPRRAGLFPSPGRRASGESAN